MSNFDRQSFSIEKDIEKEMIKLLTAGATGLVLIAKYKGNLVTVTNERVTKESEKELLEIIDYAFRNVH